MITIYGTPTCVYCGMAKELLNECDVEYKYIDLASSKDDQAWFLSQGFRTVPQIYDDEKYIGGYNDLVEYKEC